MIYSRDHNIALRLRSATFVQSCNCKVCPGLDVRVGFVCGLRSWLTFLVLQFL